MGGEIRIVGPVTAEFAEILTEPALDFVAALHREFNPAALNCCNGGSSASRRSMLGTFLTSFPKRPTSGTVSGRSHRLRLICRIDGSRSPVPWTGK